MDGLPRKHIQQFKCNLRFSLHTIFSSSFSLVRGPNVISSGINSVLYHNCTLFKLHFWRGGNMLSSNVCISGDKPVYPRSVVRKSPGRPIHPWHAWPGTISASLGYILWQISSELPKTMIAMLTTSAISSEFVDKAAMVYFIDVHIAKEMLVV